MAVGTIISIPVAAGFSTPKAGVGITVCGILIPDVSPTIGYPTLSVGVPITVNGLAIPVSKIGETGNAVIIVIGGTPPEIPYVPGIVDVSASTTLSVSGVGSIASLGLSASTSIDMSGEAAIAIAKYLQAAAGMLLSGSADVRDIKFIQAETAISLSGSASIEASWYPIALEYADNVFNKVGINLPDGLAHIKDREVHSAPFDEALGAYLVG